MEEHIRILDLASRNALPKQISEDSELSVVIVRELVEAGYLTTIARLFAVYMGIW
jgi:hypothetical protein